VSDLEATLSPTIGLIGGGVVGGWVRKNHTTAMINPLHAPMLPKISNDSSNFSFMTEPLPNANMVVITTGDKNPETRPQKARRTRSYLALAAGIERWAALPGLQVPQTRRLLWPQIEMLWQKTLANFQSRPLSADDDM